MSGSPEILIPAHGIPEEVVRIVVPASKEPISRHITVERAARVRFVVDYEGEVDFLLHLNVRSGAYVDIFYVDGHTQGRVSSRSVYGLQEHSSLNVWTFAAGGDSLIGHDVRFEQPHAFASLHGLSILNGHSNVSHQVRAFHGAANCVSRQFYKSILASEAKSEFSSLVEVVRGAQKSDSKQLNKNLLLSKKAEATSRPELRIDADDVSCAHGSATGELSQDEIFYARTRGISEHEARFLMIEGFAGEILESLPEIPLKADLSARMKAAIPMLAAA
jgi:Fe-S cluster assembly scaffold protein SufB